MSRAAIVGLSVTAFVFSFHVARVSAQHGSAPAPSHGAAAQHGSTKPTTTHGPATHSTTSHGSTQGGSSHGSTTHGNSAHATTPTTHGSAAKSSGAGHTTTSARGTDKTSTSTGGTPRGTTELTPVQQKLVKNTNLASKLQSRLPAGTTVQDAAAGFRNLGQFVAAVNVSHNLNIPFNKLKTDMVTKNMSLGQSIQQLKPSSSGTVEAQHAESEANALIARTGQTTSTTSTSTTTSARKPRT